MTKSEKAQLETAQRYLKNAVDYFSSGRVAKGVAFVENVDLLIDILLALRERREVSEQKK